MFKHHPIAVSCASTILTLSLTLVTASIAQAGTQTAGSTPAPDQVFATQDDSNDPGAEPNQAMEQLTSVSQLSDVQPTDWAFQSLQSLVERYGCIAGYPDGTYRGNRAVTRYEFAAGLNTCLDRVNELLATATAELVTKEDLATLQRLQEEFAAELATLRGRVDALEARTATLEANQFSTTTKLSGELILGLTDELSQATDNATVLQYRLRLNLVSSFTGQDTLYTRIAAGNANPFTLPASGAEGLQTFNFGNSVNSRVYIDWIAYYFKLGPDTQALIDVLGGGHIDYVPTISSYLEGFDGGNGALSVFGQRNPIYQIGGGSGIGITHKFSPTIALSAGYFVDNTDPVVAANGTLLFAANKPSPGNGLFGGEYSALAQLTFTPGNQFALGLTYIHGYRASAIFDVGSGLPATGTTLGNGFGIGPSMINAYGVSTTYKVSPQFAVNGWLSYVDANFLGRGSGNIWSYAVTFALPDLGGKGHLGGLVIGVEPYLANATRFNPTARTNNPIHIEAFYKYALSDNISITPGLIWIVAPGQDSANRDAVIGTLRGTFTF